MNRPHEEFESSTNGHVLFFSARGPWNEETLRNGVMKLSEDISRFPHDTRWAQISCLYGESLMPPSAFNIFVKHTRIRKARGLSFLAVVILDTDIMLTTKQQVSDCYEAADVPFQFYESVDLALDALREKGYSFDKAEAQRFFERFDFSA